MSDVPSGFTEDVLAAGMNSPTAIAVLPDGRVLVAEKSGLIWMYKDGNLLQTPFLDLRNRVNSYWDRGFLGITADKNFAQNGYVYLLYTYEDNSAQYYGPKTGRLSRVTATGDTASPGSEVAILGKDVGPGCGGFPAGSDCIPQEWVGHAVGSVRQASDGSLFVTIGDASDWNSVHDDALRAQDIDSLVGKLLRVSRDGMGLASNPFWNGNADAIRSKVWALGLRNPYRFTLRPTGDLPFLGDVGWAKWEEVDVAPAGANLGWPCYEGAARQAGYESKAVCQALYAQGTALPPAISWDHNDGLSTATTGGPFYTGTVFPAEYQGAYFFSDYGKGRLRYARFDSAGNLTSGPTDFATGLGAATDLVQAPDGSLYYVDFVTGQLRRIRYVGSDGGGDDSASGYLSDKEWTQATNGWGPVERDMSNGNQFPGDGRQLELNYVFYSKGLGTHAPSDVRFALGGACTQFTARVGVDSWMDDLGSVVFQVLVDGTKVFDSGLMRGNTPHQQVTVDLTGKQEPALIVTNAGDGANADWAGWVDTFVTCGSDASGGDTTGETVGASLAATVPDVIDPSSLTAATFSDVWHGASTPIEGAMPASASHRWATLDLNLNRARHPVHATTDKGGSAGVKNLAGNGMSVDTVWTFRTRT